VGIRRLPYSILSAFYSLEIDIFQDPISPPESSKRTECHSRVHRQPLEPATLPRLNSSLKALSPDPFRHRPGLQTSSTSSSSKSSGSLRSPDRFLPNRGLLDAAVQRFRANKDTNKLSLSEKVLRRNDDNPDAFSQRRAISPNPSGSVAAGRRVTSSRIGGGKGINVTTLKI
jgi:meiosis-specific APC/C activator protein AMA1